MTNRVQWVKAEAGGFGGKLVKTYHILLAYSGHCVSDKWGILNLAGLL